jgi:hypothetical protein
MAEASPAPIPKGIAFPTAGSMEVGHVYAFDRGAMVVENDGAWINPYVRPKGEPANMEGQGYYIILERADNGFIVDLSHDGRTPWERKRRPAGPEGEGWIPVVEYRGLEGRESQDLHDTGAASARTGGHRDLHRGGY